MASTRTKQPKPPKQTSSALDHPYHKGWFRFFEILPGAALWLGLTLPFLFARLFPFEVTLFIVMFDAYWLGKSLISAWLLYKGWKQQDTNLKTDWPALLVELENQPHAELTKQGMYLPSTIYNAVILTTYNEDESILRSSLESLANSKYPLERLIIVLATEGRAGEPSRKKAANLTATFKDTFGAFIVTEHPDGIVGEVKAKGANATWAAKELVRWVHEKWINPDHVVVTTADADCRFHPTYLSCLTFQYATTPERLHRGYQPIATFLNNVWEAPMLSRVGAFSTTFWHLSESVRDYRLFTFSTHAISLQTLINIDYWCTSIVNEDSRQYFRAWFYYGGKFKVLPLFMPVYMDAVYVNNLKDTFRNLYLQQQRWAYGVEHFPYLVLESFHHPEIPLKERFIQIWRAFQGTFSWGTNAFFISVVGWLPVLLNEHFRDQLIASNFPLVTQTLLTVTWIGVLVANGVSFKLLPPFPEKNKWRYVASMVLQWAFVPLQTILFGALPGIDSQTRLMLGKYLGFRVTDKQSVVAKPETV